MRHIKEHFPIDLGGQVFITGGSEIGVRIQSVGTSESPILSARQLAAFSVRVLSHPSTRENFSWQYVPLFLKSGKLCTRQLEEVKVELERMYSPAAPIQCRRLVETGFSFGRISLTRESEKWRIVVDDDAPASWAEMVNLAANIARDEWMSANRADAYVPFIPVYSAEMWTKAGTLLPDAAMDLPYVGKSSWIFLETLALSLLAELKNHYCNGVSEFGSAGEEMCNAILNLGKVLNWQSTSGSLNDIDSLILRAIAEHGKFSVVSEAERDQMIKDKEALDKMMTELTSKERELNEEKIKLAIREAHVKNMLFTLSNKETELNIMEAKLNEIQSAEKPQTERSRRPKLENRYDVQKRRIGRSDRKKGDTQKLLRNQRKLEE